MNSLKRSQHGIILVTTAVLVFTITLICLSLISAANDRYSVSRKSPNTANALLLAEAGVEQSIQQLNVSDTFAGYPSAQIFFNSAAQGKGTYTTTVTNSASDPNAKVITSTGVLYKYNSAKVLNTRIVKVTAVGTSSAGYSVYTGPGGLILSGAAGVLNADVFVNGGITMTGAAHIGTILQPVNVNVANDQCPAGATPGPTYPTVCSSGEPISLGFSTFIYGATVCATGQVSKGPNGTQIQGGLSGSGLQPGCVAPPASPPYYDYAAHVAAANASGLSGAGNGSVYNCQGLGQVKVWPNNVKITGNTTLNGICTITIKGNVYITGDFNLGAAARIIVDNSVGTTRPVVVVDGKITVNGSATILSNLSGTGIDFYSFQSNAACNPGCTSITGTALKTTQSLQTISIGGAAVLAGTNFDAYWGKITVGGVGSIGSATGQTVELNGAGNVTFGTALSTGVRTWTISSYQQKYPGLP